MPETETQDEERPFTARAGGSGNARPRATISDAIDTAGGAAVLQDHNDGAEPDEVHEGGARATGRRFKDSTEKLLDALGKPVPEHEVGDGGEDDPDDTIADIPAVPRQAAAAPATPVEAAVEEAPPPPPELEEIRAARQQLLETNRRLVAELDAKKTPTKRELAAHEKLLQEAYDSYLDDSTGAVRKMLAAILGVDDPQHPDVSAEVALLYTDLTANELGVPLDATHKAARDARRAVQLHGRDKRERKAESEKKPEPAPDADKAAAEHWSGVIANHVGLKNETTGKTIAEEFPLTMKLSTRIDGMKPEMLLWKIIERETRAGNFSPTEDGDTLVRKAAKIVESHYDGIRNDFVVTLPPPPDTTKQSAPAAPAIPASKDQRQSPAARTITNASASVAPATAPKLKPATPSEEKARKDFKNDKEYRAYLLNKHFPNG